MAQPDRGICGRTRAVIESLLEATVTANCADVTAGQLAAVMSLRLDDRDIGKLRAGDFAGLSGLRGLNLDGNRLRVLPPDIFAGLDRLTTLSLSQNQLESLPSGMLSGLPGLYALDLRENRLTEIPLDLRGVSGMTDLSLSFNPWAEIPPDLLAEMTGLRNLGLRGVGLEELPPRFFEGLTRLESLGLYGNSLTRLPSGVFDELANLRSLNLAGNRLTELPPGLFANQQGLEWLSLGANPLRRLDAGVFDGLTNLLTLYLEETELAEVPAELFRGLSNLGFLALRENPLPKLPAGLFSGLSSLGNLRLNGNALSALPPDIFSGLSNLHTLRLNDNALSALPPDIFAGLGKLRTLLLRRNGLAALPSGVFTGLRNLTELDLLANELAALPPGVFAGLSNLERVELQHNPGWPFAVPLELVRVDAADVLAPGPASVVLRVPSGAPLPIEVPVIAQGGDASGGSFSVAAGDTASAPVVVSRRSGNSGAAHVSLGALPAFPTGFFGLEFVVGAPLALFAPPANRTPVVTEEIPPHVLTAGAGPAEVDLARHFADPDGDTLSYAVASGDGGVVAARAEDGRLVLAAVSEGSAVVEVSVADADGLRAALEVPVTVLRAPDPAGFRVDVVFSEGPTAATRFSEAEKAVVRRAAARWMEVVVGDVPDVPVDIDAREDLTGDSRIVGRIDDVLVMAHIDWDNATIVASAGVRVQRESGLAAVGAMRFNRRYIESEGRDTGPNNLYETALHEIGHVLGIGGGPWDEILQNRTRDEPRDTHFPGPRAVEAFNEVGGRPYAGGKVPAENQVEHGANFHWRDSVLGDELMAPYGHLLSAITLGALADIGYEVDASRADPFELPNPDAASAAAQGEPGADRPVDVIIEGPVLVVDENGRVVRVTGGN